MCIWFPAKSYNILCFFNFQCFGHHSRFSATPFTTYPNVWRFWLGWVVYGVVEKHWKWWPACMEATEAHFFAQESSSTHRIWVRFHRIWVRFHRNWVGHTRFEFVNSIPGETNSNPVGRTWFLWKKLSLCGFRSMLKIENVWNIVEPGQELGPDK